MSQVTNQIIAEEGSPKCSDGGWACSTKKIYDLYKQHLNSAKECTEELCIPQLEYKRLNKQSGGGFGWASVGSEDEQYASLVISDGVVFSVHNQIDSFMLCRGSSAEYNTGSSNVCSAFIIDINGKQGPNIAGIDAFQFVLKEDGLYPAGCDNNIYCDKNNTNGKYASGSSCACRVIREGAINY